MKSYLVFLFQFFVYSGYTVVEWLSVYDKVIFKVMMFFVFSYIAIYIGKLILKSYKQTMLITTISIVCYGLIQLALRTFLPVT